MKVSFTILGEPVGKGRPRFSRQGEFVRTYTPKKTANYETLVKLEYERQCNGIMFDPGTPLDVRITAYMKIPESVSKKKRQAMIERKIRPLKIPDIDNLCKSVLDGCIGVAFQDDKQVVDCQVRKFYSETARTVVTIQEAI